MRKRQPVTVDTNASAHEVVELLDPVGWQGLAGKLERIEAEMHGMSRRSRLLLLNAMLRGELEAAKPINALKRGASQDC